MDITVQHVDEAGSQSEERFMCRTDGAAAPAVRCFAEELVTRHGDAGEAGNCAAFQSNFERQVRKMPHATAVLSSDGATSYGELNEHANRLANRLRELGVGPETLVGVHLPRSVDALISILGILKAGGAFLSLGPEAPEGRIRAIVNDAAPPFMIAPSAENVAGFVGRCISLEAERSAIAAYDAGNPQTMTDGDSLAYVIYTSGTTGGPKGTMLTHGGLCNYVTALQPLSIVHTDVYLWVAASSVSSSIRQSLLPLCFGAAVVIASADDIADPLHLFDLIKTRGVTIVDFVPSYWRMCTRVIAQLSEEHRRTLLHNNLRMILSTSEELSSDLPRIWRREFAHPARFINGYGHTETTGLVSLFSVPEEMLNGTHPIPIGPPLKNSVFEVCDDNDQPVAVGDEGELYVAGASVGRGYLKRPNLDAERFLNGRCGVTHERRYRTGDVVRLMAGGALSFIGRRDQQVKLNGVRVELTEIEEVLRQHPAINDAAVSLNNGNTDNWRLVAYIVAGNATGVPTDLPVFLAARLPPSMIPGEVRLVGSLPRTLSGKIDRVELKGLANVATADVNSGPASTLEREVAAEWLRVLKLKQVDIHANFFELGGDSLKSMELVSALQQKFQTDVPMLALFFEEPTIAALARGIEETSSQSSIRRNGLTDLRT
jgi:amino acid adenylation domain-containing protein